MFSTRPTLALLLQQILGPALSIHVDGTFLLTVPNSTLTSPTHNVSRTRLQLATFCTEYFEYHAPDRDRLVDIVMETDKPLYIPGLQSCVSRDL